MDLPPKSANSQSFAAPLHIRPTPGNSLVASGVVLHSLFEFLVAQVYNYYSWRSHDPLH